MAVFVEITTDPFVEVFNKTVKKSSSSRRAGVASARRPQRGLEIKEDTYAAIRVIQADGTEIPLIDSGGPNGESTTNSNFILQSANETRMEKHQIIETFGESYIYFFGEQPRFIDYQAVLINSNDFNWAAEFWENYERYLRGTRCAEIGARVYLFYDDIIVNGYMIMAAAPRNSMQPLEIPLTFRLFLTGYQNISLIGDPFFPSREGVDRQTFDESLLGSASPTGLGKPYDLISKNFDEWTGPEFPEDVQDVEDVDTTGYAGDHPDPLDQAVSSNVRDAGGDIDNADTLQSLGVSQFQDTPTPASQFQDMGAFGSTSAPGTFGAGF